MKKILSLCFALLFCATLFAQEEDEELDNTFRFVYADGTEVSDGTVLNLNSLEDYIFGGLCIPSGLYLKNTSNSAEKVRLTLGITSLSEGSEMSFCLGGSCQNYQNLGDEYKTNTMKAGSIDDLQLEWFPKGFMTETPEYGYGSATLKIEHMDALGKLVTGKGAKITLNFIYADPSGIANIDAKATDKEVSRYNVNGQLLTTPQKGLNIVKYADGKTKKVLVK